MSDECGTYAGMAPHSVGMLAVLCGACLIVYGTAMAILSPAGFPLEMAHASHWPYLADAPLGEDAFYSLTVAWNIAAGRGTTYNQGMTTAGFQPLVTFLYAGLASMTQTVGGDKFLFCRLVLGFNLAVLIVFAHQAGMLSRRMIHGGRRDQTTAYWTGFILVCTSCNAFMWFGYGLETGVYAALVCWIVRTSMDVLEDRESATLRRSIPLAIACGIAVLVRVDFLVLLLGFLAGVVMLRRRFLGIGMLVGGVAGLCLLPWLAYTFAVSGSPVQSSALAQAAMAGSLAEFLARLLFAGLMVVEGGLTAVGNVAVMAGQPVTIGLLVLAAAIALVCLCSTWRPQASGSPVRGQSAYVLGCWAAGILVLAASYALSSRAVWFYGRYMFVASALVTPLWSSLLSSALGDARRFVRALAYLLLLSSVLSFPAGLWSRYHTGWSHTEQAVLAGIVQREHATRPVGAFQSGVIGFFNENVVNLDGKMNSAALRHIRTGALGRYIEETDVRVIVDWIEQFEFYLHSPEDSAFLEARFACSKLAVGIPRNRPTWRCSRAAP